MLQLVFYRVLNFPIFFKSSTVPAPDQPAAPDFKTMQITTSFKKKKTMHI